MQFKSHFMKTWVTDVESQRLLMPLFVLYFGVFHLRHLLGMYLLCVWKNIIKNMMRGAFCSVPKCSASWWSQVKDKKDESVICWHLKGLIVGLCGKMFSPVLVKIITGILTCFPDVPKSGLKVKIIEKSSATWLLTEMILFSLRQVNKPHVLLLANN